MNRGSMRFAGCVRVEHHAIANLMIKAFFTIKANAIHHVDCVFHV